MARAPPRGAAAALAITGSAQIEHRLEVLGGYLVAYLNLDKVIKIIRNEDEPKPVLMKTFKLTDVQADAILNMRLRNLRKLEEMEIKKEDKDLRAERKELKELIGSEKEQWKTVADEIKEVRETFGPKTPLGKRRTDLRRGARARRGRDRGGAGRARADHRRRLGEGLDPRAARHGDRPLGHRVQGRRRAEVRVPGRDHVEDLVFATNGRFYTLDAAKLPGGRGHGEPVRLFVDLEQDARPRRGVPPPGRAQVPGGERAGQRLRRDRGRVPRQHPQGQAGAQRQAAGRGARAGGGRRANWSRRSARTARW